MGKCERFIRDHINYSSEECLIWPFTRNNMGYGQIRRGGKLVLAHRYMCELVNGPPPFPRAQAAHKCGQGHAGCMHPLHLKWATRAENMADMHEHGTDLRHGRHPCAKLTMDQVLAIDADDRPTKVLAKEFGVGAYAIMAIRAGRRWGWLTGRSPKRS